MRKNSTKFDEFNNSRSQELRLVIVIHYDTPLYLTSHSDIEDIPENAITNCLKNVSSVSQSLKPDTGFAEIGTIRFDVLDINNAFSTEVRTELNGGSGLKGKKVELYRGSADMVWSDFRLEQTQHIDKPINFKDGVYAVQCSDKLRELRSELFTPSKTTLTQNLLVDETTINVASTSDFEPCDHVDSFRDAPTGQFFYLKIKYQNGFEIVRATGKTDSAFTGVTRAVFGTKEVEHLIPVDSDEEAGIEVEEYVYLELPSPAMAYALMTGKIIGGGELPTNWNLGIDESDIIIEEFRDNNLDLFDPDNFDDGFVVRFQGLAKTSGKTFIEKEVALLSGFFLLIRNDGRIGLKRKTGVLTKSSYVEHIKADAVIQFGELVHDLSAVTNHIQIDWAYAEYSGFAPSFYRQNQLIDVQSYTEHGEGNVKKYQFKGLHNTRHTFTSIQDRFNAIRDRYAGPPIRGKITLLPSMNNLEVGDIVRVTDPTTQDFTDTETLDRSFEIQKIGVNQITGVVDIEVFGSSQKASPISDDSDSDFELPDLWYTSTGSDAATILDITDGVLQSNGILNGLASRVVFYIDGDFTVPSGLTLTINENVELRVKGYFQVDGLIKCDSTIDTAGYLGVTQGSDGFIVGGLRPGELISEQIASRRKSTAIAGKFDSVPSLSIDNKSGEIVGIPSDMRGTVGATGGDNIIREGGDWLIGETGAAGGFGGGSLLVVSRGGSIGPNGLIDVSGDDGELGSLDSDTYSGSGGGGAPGVFIWGLDGSIHPAPILISKVKARFGVSPTPISGVYDDRGRSQVSDDYDLSTAAASLFYVPKSREPYPDNINKNLESAPNEDIDERYLDEWIDESRPEDTYKNDNITESDIVGNGKVFSEKPTKGADWSEDVSNIPDNLGNLDGSEPIKNEDITSEQILEIIDTEWTQLESSVNDAQTTQQATDNALQVVKNSISQTSTNLENALTSWADSILLDVDNQEALLGTYAQIEVIEGQVTAHTTQISQTASKIELSALESTLRSDIAQLQFGDEADAISFAIGEVEGRLEQVEVFIEPDAFQVSVDSIIAEKDFVTTTFVDQKISDLGIENYVTQTLFTEEVTTLNSAVEILSSNVFKRSMTSYTAANKRLDDTENATLADRLHAIEQDLEAEELRGSLAAAEERIEVNTTETTAKIESVETQVAQIDNRFASYSKAISSIINNEQITARMLTQLTARDDEVLAEAISLVNTSVGYCVDEDGNITDHIDAVACVAAGHEWLKLPLSEAMDFVSVTVKDQDDNDVKIKAGTLFQAFQDEWDGLVARAFFGLVLPNDETTGITATANEDGSISAINFYGATLNWLTPSGNPVLNYDTETNTITIPAGALTLTSGQKAELKGDTGEQGETGPQGLQGEQGLKGDPGDQGIPGEVGENGQTSYLHIAYATNSTGSAGFSTSNATNKTYIGQYTDFTAADSTDYTDYTWTKIKGETGATGAQGAQGEQGDTGPQGETGAQGPQGVAGTSPAGDWTWIKTDFTGTWPSNSAINTFLGRNALTGDRLTISNGDNDSPSITTKVWNGSNWIEPVVLIDGSLVARESLSGDSLIAGTRVRSPKIEYVGSTHMRVSSASGFGSVNQFIEWFGPKVVDGSGEIDYSSITESNAIQFLKSNGEAYFGGAISTGGLTTSLATSDLSATAQIEIGPYGSNGGVITIACSVNMESDYFQNDNYSRNPDGVPTCSILLEEYVSSAWVTRQTASYTGNEEHSSLQEGNEYLNSSTQTLIGSFTYTDNKQTTTNRTYRLRMTARDNLRFTNSDVSQRLSIISQE